MRLVVPLRFAALALSGVIAFCATAAAQTVPGVSVDWDALKPPPATGASIDWNALNRIAPPPAAGTSVDWGALDALPPSAAGASVAPALHPPPPPDVALMPPTKPAEPAPAAVPRKPAAPSVAIVSPPRPPTAPRAESPAPTPPAPVVPAAAPALLPGRIAMLRFAKGQSDIPADGRDVLTGLAARLAANPGMRLQLVAYASAGSGDDPIEARRLSLTRAVALRSYLIGQGVPSVRMDVRALGDRGVGDGPADRVDLVIVER